MLDQILGVETVKEATAHVPFQSPLVAFLLPVFDEVHRQVGGAYL